MYLTGALKTAKLSALCKRNQTQTKCKQNRQKKKQEKLTILCSNRGGVVGFAATESLGQSSLRMEKAKQRK